MIEPKPLTRISEQNTYYNMYQYVHIDDLRAAVTWLKNKKVMLCEMCGELSHLKMCCGNVSTISIVAIRDIDEAFGVVGEEKEVAHD